jgi:hypothetical protein
VDGGPQPCFWWPKIVAVMMQCAPAHCHDESTSPGSTIIPNVFGRLVISDTVKLPALLMRSHCCFLDFEAKHNINALFHQIGHQKIMDCT